MKNMLKKIIQGWPHQKKQPVLQNSGHSVTCDRDATFKSDEAWLRDHYLCSNCGNIPRERALMLTIERFLSNVENTDYT